MRPDTTIMSGYTLFFVVQTGMQNIAPSHLVLRRSAMYRVCRECDASSVWHASACTNRMVDAESKHEWGLFSMALDFSTPALHILADQRV